MITKKAINENLPNIRSLWSGYRLLGETGCFKEGVRTLESAYADADDGFITIYAYEEAKARRHYYGIGCVDITDTIVNWFSGQASRKETVDEIYNMLKEYAEEKAE